MKKRLMASLLTLCMLLTLLPATALAAGTGAFTDVAEDAWYYDEVQFVKNEGLMNGVGGSQFGPELTVTRAMMVTILWRMAGSPKAEGTQFTDVAAGQYYADAALWACANGIANGCGDSTFKPDNAITREQMAAFMYRYADYKGYDMDADGDLSKFSDASAVSEYAEAAMAWANAEGLITGMGDGTLAPQGSATRAQIAAILYRFCTLLEGGSDVDGEYTVTFEWNYSDEGTYKTVTVKSGETVDKPTNPRRSGYSFSGWYTKAEGGEKFDFDTEVDEDVTLYAHWTKSSGSSHTHSWGDWTANGDGTHTRVCAKNSNHAQTEDCTYVVDDNGLTQSCAVCEDVTGHNSVRVNGGDYIPASELNAAIQAAGGDVAVEVYGKVALTGSIQGADAVSFKGMSKDATIDLGNEAHTASGIELTFEALTLTKTNDNYKGFHHAAKETYIDCTLEGTIWTYATEASFTNCIFNQTSSDAYNLWTYGTTNMTITDCTFNSAGKSLLIYNEGGSGDPTYINVSGTEFNASEAVEGKAAIEIDSTYNEFIVNIKDCTATGFAAGSVSGDTLWNNKLGSQTTVIVDGLQVLPTPETIADGFEKIGEGVYQITNINGLKYFAEQVNGGTTYAGETIKLAVDVDLNNEAWTPIGSKANQFKGTFDGQEKTISNLNVDMADTSDVGLFGFTTNGAVKNLTINNASVKGRLDVGVVAGTPYTSTYDNITLTGDIKVEGFAYVGGMFGKNAYADLSDLTIDASEDSYVKANSVEGETAYRTYVGGIVGFMGEGGHGITNAVSNIDVYGSTCDVGGITGIAHYGNSFTNCSSSGDVTITSYNDDGDQLEMGGIAGVWHNQTGQTVTFTDCEYTGTLSAVQGDGTEYTGPFMYDGLVGRAYITNGTGTGKLIINGVEMLADGLAMDEDGNYVVTNANGLAAVNSLVGVSGCGDQTVILSAGTTYDMTGVDWTPITVQGYTGADIITVQGNGATITNLSAPLFAGGFAGDSGIVISDLTIADSEITSTSDQGSGAFIECVDSMDVITLTNCHLENVTLTGSRTGGLIGWTSGYNNVNDGPVKTVVTITDCSVVDCAISGTGSVGGIIGHAGANPWTFQTITNCTVEDTTLTSSDDGDIRVGTIVGTANVGELTITDCTATDVTLTQNDQSVDEKAYGRFVPGETGKLVIDGVLITNETISGADGLAAALESVSSMNGEVTLSVEGAELGWVTGAAHGSTPFLGEDATVETVVIDGGENGATLTATGDGVGPIRAANGGTLVFKNITFVDQSKSYAENAWEFAYLEMGGKLVFENCVFSDPIQLETGAEATFTDCSFEGKTVDGLTMYAVWVGGGSATFTGCTFEGTRGIKIHEAYGSDVTEVIIDGCTFDSLSEKPGVAIGTVDETTVITITDSEFINCQAGDQDMYIYETDTDVTTFDFTESGNTVE